MYIPNILPEITQHCFDNIDTVNFDNLEGINFNTTPINNNDDLLGFMLFAGVVGFLAGGE